MRPGVEAPRVAAPPRHEADYVMTRFVVQRFGSDGALRTQIEGERLRHFPDDDTLEIDDARIRAIGSDGVVTLANARKALANGDGSEVQLLGDAHVVRPAHGKEEPIEFRGEFLHAFRNVERLRSHLPVVVTPGPERGPRRRHGVRQPGARRRPEGPHQRDLRVAAPGGAAMSATAPLVFITGASSGIGQALAARFHRAGYRLALVARRADEVARWAAAQGFDAGDAGAVYGADVRDVAAITGAGRACIAAQGAARRRHRQRRHQRRHGHGRARPTSR